MEDNDMRRKMSDAMDKILQRIDEGEIKVLPSEMPCDCAICEGRAFEFDVVAVRSGSLPLVDVELLWDRGYFVSTLVLFGFGFQSWLRIKR